MHVILAINLTTKLHAMIRSANIILLAAAMLFAYASAETCGQLNESSNICGRMCEPTCRVPKPIRWQCPGIQCVWGATSGCRCNEGYLRNSDGSCVLQKDCRTNKSN